MAHTQTRRIWGWMAFDFASQPFYTLGLTFIFGPYFAYVATELFISQGLASDAAKSQSQSLWALGQTLAGLVIAFSAPFLGAFADASGRKMPWIAGFSVIYIAASWSLWWLTPDGSTLWLILALFYIGMIAAESALNFVNAFLPSLGTQKEIGRISGTGFAIGYWGGVVALFIMLLFFAENATGVTFLGKAPLFGLDPDLREGTRLVGPFIAIWYAIFIIPFFLYVRDDTSTPRSRPSMSLVWSNLRTTIKSVFRTKSLGSFLLSSMLYRDALNALYAFGGVYARLVLEWSIVQIGIFGIVGAITAAIASYIGGRMDEKTGPKPVITVSIILLIIVSIIIVGMSRESFFGIPFAADSGLPDIIMYLCGAIIGGAGGVVQAASRSLMVRHTNPDRPTEAFGLFALSGKATAFLAPALIGLFAYATGSVQLSFLPVIFLFLLGLALLSWVNKDGVQTT